MLKIFFKLKNLTKILKILKISKKVSSRKYRKIKEIFGKIFRNFCENILKLLVIIETIRYFSEIKQIYCNKLRYFGFWKIQEIVV